MDSPEEAVVRALTRPRQESRVIRRTANGGVARLGGHVPARPETIHFLKEQIAADTGLLAVAFEDVDGQQYFWTWGVSRQADGGWAVGGGAGGSGQETSTASVPWANLGAWWNDRHFCAGGRVHDPSVQRLRLVDGAGRTVEDTVDEGIVLLTRAGPFQQPWNVELYAAAGRLVRRHPFHGAHPAAP